VPVTAAVSGAALPVTYGVVVDVGKGQRHALEQERKAIRALMAKMAPNDTMFVVQFAKPIELLCEPTGDRAKLEKAVNEIGTESANFKLDQPKGPDVDSEGRRLHNNVSSLNDAVFLAVDDVLAKSPNKHVLVVMSDGVDEGSKMSMSDAMESIQRNNVIVYTAHVASDALEQQGRGNGSRGGNGGGSGRSGGSSWPFPGSGGGYPGQQYPGSSNPNGQGGNNNPNGRPSESDRKPHVDGASQMERLANNTGGRLIDGDKKGSFEENAAGIADDMHAMYWLTLTPTGPAGRHGYHPFDVQVTGSDKGKKVEVSAPVGYYRN